MPRMSADLPASEGSREERVEAAIAEWFAAAAGGAGLERSSWLAGHGDLASEIELALARREKAATITRDVAAAETAILAPSWPEPPPSTAIPRRVGDHEVLGEIARGGMGVVYRARHLTLG